MQLIKKSTGESIEFASGMSWVKHYDKGTNKTMIMMGDSVVEEVDGDMSLDKCDFIIAANWDIRESEKSNYDKLRPIWEGMHAVSIGGYVSNDWSLEPPEEISDLLADNENPIVISIYGIDNNGEKFEFYFDMADINEGELDLDMQLIAKDGEVVTALIPYI